VSFRNKLRIKAIRRVERAERVRRPVPFLGVWVRKTDVLGHRYLASEGLPHSESSARVVIHA